MLVVNCTSYQSLNAVKISESEKAIKGWYSSKRNGNNVWWELRNDKKLRKSLVGKTCYAQIDRLVNSDNSTESPILKAIGRGGGGHPNNKILISEWMNELN